MFRQVPLLALGSVEHLGCVGQVNATEARRRLSMLIVSQWGRLKGDPLFKRRDQCFLRTAVEIFPTPRGHLSLSQSRSAVRCNERPNPRGHEIV